MTIKQARKALDIARRAVYALELDPGASPAELRAGYEECREASRDLNEAMDEAADERAHRAQYDY